MCVIAACNYTHCPYVHAHLPSRGPSLPTLKAILDEQVTRRFVIRCRLISRKLKIRSEFAGSLLTCESRCVRSGGIGLRSNNRTQVIMRCVTRDFIRTFHYVMSSVRRPDDNARDDSWVSVICLFPRDSRNNAVHGLAEFRLTT